MYLWLFHTITNFTVFMLVKKNKSVNKLMSKLNNYKEFFMKKIMLFSSVLFASIPALANEAVAAASTSNSMYAISAAIAIGFAAFGGTFAQGKIGASAMEGIARNPEAQKSMFVPMIISLVLIESLVIYALVVAFQLVGKI